MTRNAGVQRFAVNDTSPDDGSIVSAAVARIVVDGSGSPRHSTDTASGVAGRKAHVAHRTRGTNRTASHPGRVSSIPWCSGIRQLSRAQ